MRFCRPSIGFPVTLPIDISPMRALPTLPSQLSHIHFSAAPFRLASLSRSLDRTTSCALSRNFSTSRREYQALRSPTTRTKVPSAQLRPLNRPRYSNVRSGITLGFIWTVGAGLGLAVTLLYTFQSRTKAESPEAPEITIKDIDSMTAEMLPGRPGNLTPEQEEKLRQLWQLIFQVCGVGAGDEAAPGKLEKTPTADTKKSKKSRMGFLRRGKKDGETDSAHETTDQHQAGGTPPVILGNHGDEDKHGQVKHFYDTLTSQSPEFIRDTIWSMVKHDHPDALALRFLRARKWDVEKALIMFISTINWRATDMKVDEIVMRSGEGGALEAETTGEGMAKTLGRDFLSQIRMGKSYIHGHDKAGRPICVVRVRLHKAGEQCEASLERYTVYLIETTRMMLHPPVDTATILFDMTGFSMANMDYTPVKFMIKCFEANYPESLGTVLIHNAPWLFQGIWRVVRGWLDPVVASKINFTNNAKDLEAFIERSKIPKELDGDEDWTYTYVEPTPGENDIMKDTATRDSLLAGREQLYHEYEEATMEWIHSPQSPEMKARRNQIAERLRQDYWRLDPYIRARSFYDRVGILKKGGEVDYYPKEEAAVNEKVKNGVAASPPPPAAVAVAPADDDID